MKDMRSGAGSSSPSPSFRISERPATAVVSSSPRPSAISTSAPGLAGESSTMLSSFMSAIVKCEGWNLS